MSIDKVLVVLGEPNSIFSEILAKFFYSKKFKLFKKKIIIIGNIKLFKEQTSLMGYNFNFHEINNLDRAMRKKINFINIEYQFKQPFEENNKKSKIYLQHCFKKSLDILKKNKNLVLINGPISKIHFLNRKYLGITEYLSKKTRSSSYAMLIYNKKLSVVPITTHLPINQVSKNISKKIIIDKIRLTYDFFKNKLNKVPKIAVLGLNPHCESIQIISEEKKYIVPAINLLKKKMQIDGPFSADTFFINKNVKKYDLVIGMYHDQVLTPIKTLFGFEAINITIGLPFIRISPDHGPNHKMAGKKLSDPTSIFYALEFINKFK